MSGPQPVQAAAAVKGDIPITLTALGTVTPLATVTVRTQINGHLMQIGFTEGQMVKQGAFLAQVDPRPYTGTVELRGVFKNSDDRLFPNEFVNVTLLVDTLKDTVVVPAAAIQRGAPGTFVYVVGADGIASLRVVGVGPVDGDRVAMLSGLKPGEQVVTDGAEQLKDGSQVTLPAAGTVAYTAVVTAQATALSSEQTALNLEQQRLVASVTLIEDLGGGWSDAELPTSGDVSDGKAKHRCRSLAGQGGYVVDLT